MRQLSQLFLDARCLTTEFTQVVQLGFADITATLHLNRLNLLAEGLERTLHAHAVGDFAHGKGGVQSTVATTNHHAFESLQTLALTFNNFHLNYDRIAGAELR